MKNIQKSIKISVLSIGLLLGFCAQAMGPKSLIPAKLTQSSAVDKAKTMAKTVVQKVGAVPLVAIAAQAVGLVDPTFAMGIVAGKAEGAKALGCSIDALRKKPKSQKLLDIKKPKDVCDEMETLLKQDQFNIDVDDSVSLKTYAKLGCLAIPTGLAISISAPAFGYGVFCGIGYAYGAVLHRAYKIFKEIEKETIREIETPETIHDLVALQQDYDAIADAPGQLKLSQSQSTALDVAPKDQSKLFDQVTK